MNFLSLFSGGGLGDYGLELSGMNCVGQVEIDKYCQQILNLRWPNVPKWGDIRNAKGKEIKERCGTVDLVSGGFPCQPFSVAGKQRGKQDDRYLWPEMLRVISEVKPAWVLGENVSGIIKFALDTALSDLENLGYTCQSFVVPACAVDAPHRRDRVWIVAHSEHNGRNGYEVSESLGTRNGTSSRADRAKQSQRSGCGDGRIEDVADSKFKRCLQVQRQEWTRHKEGLLESCGWTQWPTEPGICRVAYGIAHRVDRLKLLGNGQVVPLVKWIGEQIILSNKEMMEGGK